MADFPRGALKRFTPMTGELTIYKVLPSSKTIHKSRISTGQLANAIIGLWSLLDIFVFTNYWDAFAYQCRLKQNANNPPDTAQ